MIVDNCDDSLEEPRALIWARQVMEHGPIVDEDIAEAPGVGIAPCCRHVIVGQRVAYTTGQGEIIRWQDILVMADMEAGFQRAALAAGA